MVRPVQSAVVVTVPAAASVVDEHRARLDPAAGWGVPPHVTVLYPFVSPDLLDDPVVARLAAAVRRVAAFDCHFARTDWFGADVLYLAPEPAEPFRLLTSAVWAAFPEHPPYGGEFADVVPHLTVGHAGNPDQRPAVEAAAADVTALLPVHQRIEAVSVLVGSFAPGSWHEVLSLPLG